MKLLLIFLSTLTLSAGFSQEEEEEGFPYSFYEEQVVYLLGDSVNIRKEPNLKSTAVSQLPVGTKVTIVRETTELTRLNGILMPWYEIQYDGKKRGFVWGGKLAQTSFRSNGNNEYAFHFGLEKIVDGEVFFQLRIEKAQKELQRVSIRGFGTDYKPHTITNKGNCGLKTLDDVIYIDASSEYCGDGGGSMVFFFSGGKLSEEQVLFNMMDAPFYTSNYFIFPSDMEGQKDRIILHEEAGEYVDDDANPDGTKVIYSKNSDTRYKWDGKALLKVN